MKIGFITTSRADFGIYLPLIRAVESEKWEYDVYAGGMHTAAAYGNTSKLIETEYKIRIAEKITSLTGDDSQVGVARAMGATTSAFAEVWERKKPDILFALGDRYEMFSAALSSVPFNILLAHLHGGETTLGAIDNKFRHALTAISDYHFVSAEVHARRVAAICGSSENVFNVGALGLEGIRTTELYTAAEFFDRFQFDVEKPFVLVTYHPETVDLRNALFVQELISALKSVPYTILCTLPNADTEGTVIRNALLAFEQTDPNKIKCVENLGQRGYYSAMYYCEMLIGNTSSGIIEAASFNKPVINVGDRQAGRTASKNILHADNSRQSILDAFGSAEKGLKGKKFENVYGDGYTSQKIIKILKSLF